MTTLGNRSATGRLSSTSAVPIFQGSKVGCPIRKSTDQSLFAAPHGLSQRITSFIACACQGIHQMPLRHLIVLIANAHQVDPKIGRERQALPLHSLTSSILNTGPRATGTGVLRGRSATTRQTHRTALERFDAHLLAIVKRPASRDGPRWLRSGKPIGDRTRL